jgi:hypothetical protein
MIMTYPTLGWLADVLDRSPARADVETGFFARWWDEQPDGRRNITRALVANGQLEFINGARGHGRYVESFRGLSVAFIPRVSPC